MTPTEHELTIAVDAAAQHIYRRTAGDDAPPWRDLGPVDSHRYRELALPLARTVLEALPDRAPAARLEALELLGRTVAAHICSCGTGPLPLAVHQPWCAVAPIYSELGG